MKDDTNGKNAYSILPWDEQQIQGGVQNIGAAYCRELN